jgi:lipopolysaccharide/colanic/teichoic acid biosynthesis glycosyltransferase
VDSSLNRPRTEIIRRLLDIMTAIALAIPAAPIGAAIALAIALETPGPIFFTHTRLGKGRRPFRLWKFRSMRADADEVLDRYLKQHPELLAEWHQTHKLKNDPRVTRVGRWLRRSSLDELPQLWNVLTGSMSLIGPRPIVAEEIPKYGAALDQYERVRPGLTGLWQVSGRTDLSYRRRIELDTEYICHRTFALDLKILWRTVRVVLRGHGAY